MTTLREEQSLSEAIATLAKRLDELMEYMVACPTQGTIDRVYRHMSVSSIDTVLDEISQAIDDE